MRCLLWCPKKGRTMTTPFFLTVCTGSFSLLWCFSMTSSYESQQTPNKKAEVLYKQLYGIFKLKIVCLITWRIKSFFPYKDNLAPSLKSKVVHRANCWDCKDFHIGKTKLRLHDRKTEHFKALTTNCHESAIANRIFSTNHRIKWDHFKILAIGRPDMHCKIKVSISLSFSQSMNILLDYVTSQTQKTFAPS